MTSCPLWWADVWTRCYARRIRDARAHAHYRRALEALR